MVPASDQSPSAASPALAGDGWSTLHLPAGRFALVLEVDPLVAMAVVLLDKYSSDRGSATPWSYESVPFPEEIQSICKLRLSRGIQDNDVLEIRLASS